MLFFASVARFYHRGTGFTALIGFPPAGDSEPPALQAVPHYQYPLWASYDGQFYAQRALDPLLRDPTIDRGMDLAPFRARRILFSGTAYVLGMGKPVWILLPANSDWRWLRNREDSPWYPTARLFRQRGAGEWGEVIERVGNELRELLSCGT